jgi:hypothetical protein
MPAEDGEQGGTVGGRREERAAMNYIGWATWCIGSNSKWCLI